MADAKTRLGIEVAVKNQQALGRLNNDVNRLKSSTGSLGSVARAALGVFAAIGATRLAKGLVDVSRSVESLRLRFKFLFGSAEEGAKAFQALTEFAGRVPFSLDEIAAASGNLAVVSKDAEELTKNLEITANVAAISGLDFKTAGEQIQRSLVGGISAADLLRERGVKALLGFKDGVKITTEETAAALQRDFGPDGKFGQAAIALANTFDGTLSMIGDKFFNFQLKIGDAGGFDQLKAAAALLDDFLQGKFGDIQKSAEKIGQGIITATEDILLGSGKILDAVSPIFSFVRTSFNNILTATDALPGAIKTLGVIGFLMLGLTGKAIVLTIGAALGAITELFADFMDVMAAGQEKIGQVLDALGFEQKAQEYKNAAGSLRKETEALRKKFTDLGKTFDGTSSELDIMLMKMEDGTLSEGEYTKQALELIKALREKREELKAVNEELDGMIDKNGNLIEQDETLADKVRNLTEAYKGGFKNAMKEGADLQKQLGQAGARAFNGMADSLANFVMTGKFNFKEFTRSVISDLMRIAAKIAIIKGIEMLTGFKIPFLAKGGVAKANQPVVVGEQGPELFVPNSTGTVVPNDQLTTGTGMAMAGEVNVNFNINAVDAASFDELLLSRKGLIIGTIQQAFRQQGRRFA